MASTYTTNYSLEKPDPAADININPINSDMDLIDAALTEINNAKTMQSRVFRQLNASGGTNSNGVTQMPLPTEPGVYRVTTKLETGLPEAAAGYGSLVVFNAGGYPLYIYVDANQRFWYSRVATEVAPTNWYELQKNDAEGDMSANATVTFTMRSNRCMIQLSRINQQKSVLLGFDYWSSGYSVLGGELPSNITITKSANSNTITIKNNYSYVIAYKQM